MINEMLKRLKAVMSVQTASYKTEKMNKFILKEVAKIPGCYAKKHKGNIYVTRGKADLYPCIVAHTDTVHDIHKEFHVLEVKGKLIAINEQMERVGVGGDDKVGIFVALEMLRNTDICKAAFFRDEEVGCRGSREADMKFFDNVTLALQCDRQGYDDFVNEIYSTTLYDESFGNAISAILSDYGKFESDGGLTDVYQLAENGLGVACANMSCGYYDPHTDNEYIIIDEVELTLSMVKEIVDACGGVKWEITEKERNTPIYPTEWSYNDYGYRRYGNATERRSKTKNKDNAYYQDVFDTIDDSIGDATGSGGSPEKNKSCLNCEGHETLYWDEYHRGYYCMGCMDYVDNGDILYLFPESTTQGDKDFLDLVEEEQDKIDSKKKSKKKV